MRSLSTKFVLLNGLMLVLVLSGFGFVQLRATDQTIRDMMDRDLFARADGMGRGRPQGPPPQGFGPPNEGRQPGRPRDDDPIRGPRMFDVDGEPLDPNRIRPLWSESMFQRSKVGERLAQDLQFNGETYRVVSVPMPGRDRIAGVVQVAQPWAPFRLAQQAQHRTLMAALPLAFAVAAGLALILARLVLGPVARLTQAAERIASDPRHQEDIAVDRPDEIGRLAGAFNAMISRLQSSNEELARSLEQQRRFTSDAAHELRTPLTSITLAAENGLHPKATPEEMRTSLETVSRAGDSMTRLTQLLLTLARRDHGGEELQIERTLLAPLVQLAVREYGAQVEVDIAEDANSLLNPDATRQIIQNIVENGLAHSESSAPIKVWFKQDELAIGDSGIGIPAEHLPHLFDRFYRVDGSRQKGRGGFGLGLAIVQALCDAQDASIRVESQVGVGTTFFISFSKKAKTS